MLLKKISVPNTIALEKPYLFMPSMIELPLVIRVPPLDFLDNFDKNITEQAVEINIIFKSDLQNMKFSHYMDQPKSMLCRKLIKKFIGEVYAIFDYNWFPKCFGKKTLNFYHLNGDSKRYFKVL